MRVLRFASCLRPCIAAAAMLAAMPACAYTCYVLYDRSDNVIYRDTLPPVDMSDAGQAARDALRARGEYLMVSEADHCPPVVFRMGDAGSSGLVVDRAVAGMAPGAVRGPAAALRPSTPATATAPRRTPTR